MARRRLIWHVGPADPGAGFLTEALDTRRAELAERGVQLPRGDDWPHLEKQVWDHKGTTILSTPHLSRARQEEVLLRLTGLRDVEVHLVFLARDLRAQVYSGWQQAIQSGSTTGLEKYAGRVMAVERDHWQAEEFWTGRDLAVVLDRWTGAMVPDRVHVIAATGERELWDAVMDIAGVENLPCPTDRISPLFVAGLDPELLLDITTGWTKQIAEKGFSMRGSLIEDAAAGAIPSRGQQFDVIAELLAEATTEVARLREEVAELREVNARLDRKRRKHKQRVRKLEAG